MLYFECIYELTISYLYFMYIYVYIIYVRYNKFTFECLRFTNHRHTCGDPMAESSSSCAVLVPALVDDEKAMESSCLWAVHRCMCCERRMHTHTTF